MDGGLMENGWGWTERWIFTATTAANTIPNYQVVGDTKKLDDDVAFLRDALKLAHDRIDELEQDDGRD
jgi:hypothetical protein